MDGKTLDRNLQQIKKEFPNTGLNFLSFFSKEGMKIHLCKVGYDYATTSVKLLSLILGFFFLFLVLITSFFVIRIVKDSFKMMTFYF